jgi:hypothetical protein
MVRRKRQKDKYVQITTQDGTVLNIRDTTDEPMPPRTGPNLIDLLPSPEEAAKGVNTGLSDEAISAAWLYGENGKAPR